jgi:uncharacterized protein (TIGR00725 family)
MDSTKKYIGVIGASSCPPEICKLAEEVGAEIAKAEAILICGGLGGVMEAVCKGAKEQGGITIGILPGVNKDEANPYVDFPVPTGLGEGRNVLIVRSADVLIAISGGYGTLSEVGFALRLGKPLVSLGSWDVSDEILKAETPKQAVNLALTQLKKLEYV